MKGKKLQPTILYQARLAFRFEGETNSFTDKQKLKEFSITKLALHKMLKRLFQAEKTTARNMEITKVKISMVKANTQ